MHKLFTEIPELCRDEKFLHSVMKKYHYNEEEYPVLRRLAEEMYTCLQEEAVWQDLLCEEAFSEKEQPFYAIGITLGKGIDDLQENYLKKELLTESYMIEVLSSELLLKSYRSYTEWTSDHRNLHASRLYFLGSGGDFGSGGDYGSTAVQTELNRQLQIEYLPELLKKLDLPITCNKAYCMLPKKSVVFYAKLTTDPFVKCAGICLGCGRRDCPNRMEEKEDFPLHFADMTDRPLSYGYARIFSKK